MKKSILFLFLCAIYLFGCAEKRERNFAQRFVDADTNKPIEGVYANAIWIKSFPGKRGSECMQSALLRSGPDGWVRQSAPEEGSLASVTIFAPGYEYMSYERRSFDRVAEETVLNRLAAFRMHEAYPAWTPTIEAMGYRYEKEHYVKEFVLKHDPDETIQKQTVHLITRRGYPPDMTTATQGVIGGCDDLSRRVGLKDENGAIQWQFQRELISMICDPRWDTANAVQNGWLSTALTFKDKGLQERVSMRFKADFPERANTSYDKPFSKPEREKFCTWIWQFEPKF